MDTIKSRLADGKQVNVLSIGAIPSPKLVELVALIGGYHGIWIDEEHAAVSLEQIESLTLACRSVGLDSYVRLAPVHYAAVMRPMEAGAGGIMAAQIRGVEEARQIVRWAKFPPLGERGLNASNFEGQYATRPLAAHVEACNRDRWLAMQIETLEALQQVEEIAAVPGVDHLFVGPADLSLPLGVPGEFMHARCLDALRQVSQAVEANGKSWGILVRGREHAEVCRELGCRLFAYGNDLSVILGGLRGLRSNYDGFFES
jgi:2-dehydro-3-deoxyglucarate aldolase/4-hydroxy-2-oxoheptanedioate aldolase